MYDDYDEADDVALYEGDETGGDCDDCGEYVPNGHGHYPDGYTDRRVCGDCADRLVRR